MSRILINLVDLALTAASQIVAGQTQVVASTPADCSMSDGVRAGRPARVAALGAAPFLTPGVLRARSRGPVDTKVVARAHAAPIGLGAGARPYTPDFLRLGFVVRSRFDEPIAQAPQNNLDYFVNTHRERGTLRVLNPQAQILAVYRHALTVLGLDPNQFQLHVIEDADPGAFWVNGTRAVFVTTGLLKKPNLTAGELAWVLNHELGHFLKHRPGLVVPQRFKNPLFRRYAVETHAALGQAEEYDADELGFVITDAMGFSIDEGLNMARWLAGFDRKEAATHTAGMRVLTPGKTHPYGHHRVACLETIAASPCFLWQNRLVGATPLPFSSGDFGASPKPTRRVFSIGSEALKIGVLAKIAAHPWFDVRNTDLDPIVFDENNIRVLLFYSLNRKKIAAENEARDMIQELRRAANKGDMIARAYLDALLTKLYLDTLKGGPIAVQQRLEWFKVHCGLSADEVLFALVVCYESHGAFLHDLIEGKIKSDTYGPKHFFNEYPMPSKDFPLLAVVEAFPHSALRDRFIFTLLNYGGCIADRDRFIEAHVGYGLPVPLTEDAMTVAGLGELVPMFYNRSFCQVSDVGELFEPMEETENRRLREEVEHSLFLENSNLKDFFEYVYFTAGPYDRGKLEAELAEFTGYPFWYTAVKQGDLLHFFSLFMKRAEEFQGFARERVLGFVRVFALRLLEAIPVQEWQPNTMAFVERMPASSERNHLLLLLDEAGVRVAQAQELVFRDIPSPEQAGSASDQISFLHAFGFVGTGQGEVIYPSGQRLLDRHVARTWPQAGDLVFVDVVHTIPRASPIRDEYLDRCPVADADEARRVLDAYWSPQAAYARAFEICSAWIAALPVEDAQVLDDIYRITDEFPSLRRRMIHNWVDRFGIAATEYSRHITATQSCDAMDLYSGAVAGHAGQMNMEGQIAVCVASFSSALVRDGSFSLLSIVDEGTSGISRTTSFLSDKNEDDDEGIVEDDADDSDAVTIEDKVKTGKDFFANFYAVMPERALELAALLTHGHVLRVQRIPFVEGKPAADRRFKRSRLEREAGKKLQEWQGTRAFGRFMRALGWKEAVVFYEGFFLGKDGILSRPSVAAEVEKIFLEGVAVLLQDKLVPLARVENVAQSLALFLAHQSPEMRGRIWARILAGIAQEQSLGEIVREAVRPLGSAAGGKLMQAVHSLTVGVDDTLEAATRLSLDQVAAFDLFDALRFLGARGFDPFVRHERVTLLGQGSVRAAIAGRGGESPEAAYLLVHAGPADPLVVRAVAQFIYRLTRGGQYFPLTATQFQGLVRQTDAERLRGFELHREFGELHGWRLGSVMIPRVEEIFGDWARVELVRGRAFSSLPPDVQVARASRILEGAVAQLHHTRPDGSFFINPEWHGGNIVSDQETGTDSLVDCGLVGVAVLVDVLTLPQIHAAFAQHGLAGVVALLIKNQGFKNLSGIENKKRDNLIASLRVFVAQLAAGTAPELLLAGLVETVQRSTSAAMSPGLDVLFRATQHLSPYARLVPGGGALSGILTAGSPADLGELPLEIERALQGENPAPAQTRSIPKGIAIGRAMSDGRVVSSGVLTADCDLDKVSTEGDMAGIVPCQLATGKQYVRPDNLRIQAEVGGKTQWVTVAEWLEIQSRRR